MSVADQIPDRAAAAASERLRQHGGRNREGEDAEVPSVPPVEGEPAGMDDGQPSLLDRLRDERLTTAQLLRLPPPTPLIKGWLYEGTTNIVYGRPKCGKTLIIMDLALSLATGKPWRDVELDARPVLYLIGEGNAGLGSRSRAWAYQHDIDLNADWPIHFIPVPFSLNRPENAAALARLVADLEDDMRPEGGYRLIVFDTLARYSAGVEENSNAMQTIVDRIDYVRRSAAPQATALIAHHTNVAGDKRSRGHGATDAAVDLGLFVEKADDVVSAEVVSFRNGPEGAIHKWRQVTVPEARQGEEDYDPPTVVADYRTKTTELILSRRELLEELKAIQIGDEWVPNTRWQEASNLNERTFHRAKKDLVVLGYVDVNETGRYPTYRLSEEERATDTDTDTALP